MVGIWTFIFLLAASLAQAATIYVDKDVSCPSSGGVYCSIQNGLNAVTGGGDIVRIRDAASAYDENATLSTSGSSGNPVIIEPDTGHNPTLRHTGSSGANGVINLPGTSYVRIQNLNFNGSGVHTSAFAVLVTAPSANSNGVEILNNTFQNWGGTASNANTNAVRAAVGVDGGWCNPTCPGSPTGTIVQGNTFTDNRQNAIFLQHAENTLIENNTISGMKCGRTVDATTDAIGIGIWDSGTSSSSGTIIRNNTIRDHQPYSSCGLTPGAYQTYAAIWCDVEPRNGLIEKNLIYNINQEGDGANMESQGLFIEAGCSGWVAKNNIIHDIGGAGIRQRMARSGRTANQYYNNTIYVTGTHGFEGGNTTGSAGIGNATIENNIFMDAGQYQVYFEDPAGSTITVNYNLYYSSTGGGIGLWNGSGGNFTQWKTAYGGDANSVNSNPLFVNAASGNFQLQSGSPGATAGLTIGAVTEDYAGTSRTAPYSMGAYEFVAGGIARRKVNQN